MKILQGTLKEMFKKDFMQFFELLIKSYGGEILVDDIKNEVDPGVC